MLFGYTRQLEEDIDFLQKFLDKTQEMCLNALEREMQLRNILEKFNNLGSYEYLKRLVEADKKKG